MTSSDHPLTVGSRFGPYRLDRLIGRGGMGEVYQAYDTVKDRTVAIKVLPERMAQDPVYRQRFQRESHAAARLREARVIPIHDYGEIEGRLFIDMRLVDGDSLRALLQHAGPGSPERTVRLIEQVAAALDAAHADGLLHRDVKPDNILLTKEGFAYLVDFGIAQSATDDTLTSAGGAVGSYRYMAPERFSSRELTPAADVYALACVLFECLTGTRPFSGETEAQIMSAYLFAPVPRPSQVRSTTPETFDPIIAHGMAKLPQDRYPTAGALAAAAHAALSAAHAAAGVEPSPGARTGEWARTGMGPRDPQPQRDATPSGPRHPSEARTEADPTAHTTGAVAWAGGPPPSVPVRPGTDPARPQTDPHRPGTDPGRGGADPSRPGTNPGRPATGPVWTGPNSPGTTTGSGQFTAAGVRGHTDPGSTGTAEPHPGTDGTGGHGGIRRGRRWRRVGAILAVLVLVVAAWGFAGWAHVSGTKDGAATADGTALNAADVELLSLINGAAYRRAGCYHERPDTTMTAIFFCPSRPEVAAPSARFLRFKTADGMRDHYRTLLNTMGSTNCPGDPAGSDAPSLVDGKEVGRKSCYANRAETPDSPKPTLILTNEAAMAIVLYIYADPTETTLRDYRAKTNGGQFRTPDKAQDPDVFTAEDLELMAHTGDSYRAPNCRHIDPPAGPTAAMVECGTPLGEPGIGFLGFVDRQNANVLYQANLGQLPGHACGGSPGSDDVWRKSGSAAVGRFFCFTSKDPANQVPCLMAMHDNLSQIVMICALPEDSPENGPKTEAAVLTWFQENFG
ncbi:serine/threonine-protein kinase [Nocardia crassostreae]|uniref:serine/threonine-protein kinase n=1 Tax=Nocardia crassostreae TaxID=53428 RepID=UPI00082B543B|nr:serine/threonine-protein kinase [Nocardia crassostreae]